MEDAGNKGNLLVLFGTPVKYASLSFGIARGTADFTDPPASPVRLALPVRHRLRLRRLPGGHGRRAGVAKHCGQVSRLFFVVARRIQAPELLVHSILRKGEMPARIVRFKTILL